MKNFPTAYLLGCGLILTVAIIGSVNSIKCFQCGLYKSSVSSVTPCLNLTRDLLKECPVTSTHCTKHVGSAIFVYGCDSPEMPCVEGTSGYFETYCCNDANGCNGVSSLFGSGWSQWKIVSVSLLVSTLISLASCCPFFGSSLTSLV